MFETFLQLLTNLNNFSIDKSIGCTYEETILRDYRNYINS